jgi:hypothetical protein
MSTFDSEALRCFESGRGSLLVIKNPFLTRLLPKISEAPKRFQGMRTRSMNPNKKTIEP